MLRSEFSDALRKAMKAKDARAVSTLRLILAALKDRDIAARSKGNTQGVDEDEIRAMLQSMIKQRRETMAYCEKGGRVALAEQEAEEIGIIQRFLPEPMSEAETKAATAGMIDELGATGLKDMGRVMAALRERYAGRMDFARASALVKEQLG